MIRNIQIVKKAREMRLSGNSLAEIQAELNIPKSTLSNWLRDISLSREQVANLQNRMENRVARGRLNSLIVVKSKRIHKEKTIYEECERYFPILIKNPLFALGIGLYLANGSKRSSYFQFTNSDITLIKLMDMWIKKYLSIDNSLIKHRVYEGYSRIIITRIDIQRKMVAWQKLLIKYYSGV